MSMIAVTEDLPKVVCDCPSDEYPKYLGHVKDNVLHTPVQLSTREPPKKPRKRAAKKETTKNDSAKKVPKMDLRKHFVEIPPVVDEKGEQSEVQVFEEFDPDELLPNLFNQLPPKCPRCFVTMTYGCVKTPDGTDWKYYRCPATW